MTSVILCGGSGTRLWPLSRKVMPKQFLELFSADGSGDGDSKKSSLFELAVKRNAKLCEKMIIVANSEHYFLAKDQMGFNSEARFILEPFGKNTAAAIALACLALNSDEIVLVTPSDHLIKNELAYAEAVSEAKTLLSGDTDERLITFGVRPSRAETGYGYIKTKDRYGVEAFIEKPDLDRAEQFIKSGEYLWNSGMFAFRAGAFLNELQKHAPDIHNAAKNAFLNAENMGDFIRVKPDDMDKIPNESIDYAVMEKSENIAVIACEASWSDVGSFESLAAEFPKSGDGNAVFARFEGVEAQNNFIISNDKNKLIAAIGVSDLMIIDTGDALLIGKKSESQKVKEIYQKIAHDEKLAKYHLTSYKPWGSYTVLEDENGYKIKRIEVLPGKRLSLQSHQHRSEHWIIISGTASVEVEGRKMVVRPNESTFIKIGDKHRLSNEGKISLILIEVQVGQYTGEDDITRFEDDFRRSEAEIR